MLQFLRFDDFGLGLVAVFNDTYAIDRREVRLSEGCLVMRIDNLRAYGIDTSSENAALVELRARKIAADPVRSGAMTTLTDGGAVV